MTKVANAITLGLVFLLILNGIRLTFFPLQACHLVRGNQIPTIEESVMKFHKTFGGPDDETE